MLTRFKLMCRLDIEATIDVPGTGFYLPTETGGRLNYSISGKYKCLPLPCCPIAFAKFFKKHGLIDRYNKADGKMYRISLLTVKRRNGQPIQHRKLFEIKREDILSNLNPAQVQTIAAADEMSRNKVIQTFINKTFKAA